MSGLRFAIDTGGTFTDLIVENASGDLVFHKSPTTPDDPVRGVINVLRVAAEAQGKALDEFLSDGISLLHGTTRALNAVLSHKTARTAFLTTQGHPDVLMFREGGRENVFDFSRDFPAPYVPRALTWEVPERIGAAGEVVTQLNEARVAEIADEIAASGAEAVAVCLLWSPVNAAHEERVGEILAERLPGIPVTLSHRLAPMLREYRRASAAAMDASLKPLMTDYLSRLEEELRGVGFAGRLLIVTSNGGVLDAAAVAQAPILAINSGPSMAPVAGLHYARMHVASSTAIVADTGGTSYDVSLVRDGHIPRTRETWLGDRFYGHMTGFPSVDISSIGAGGGSIAWVDEGGLLRIGPESAGADPGPACYLRGGTRPTVTDACVTLGYVDPDYFLGGKMKLDAAASHAAITEHVATPLGLSIEAAAFAMVDLATEQMVHAIEDVTVNHGVDPAAAILVAGGGAAGLNSVKIGSRLGVPRVLFPNTGAVLSAAGALLADLSATFTAPLVTTSAKFDFDGVNKVLAGLKAKCEEFISGPGSGASRSAISFSVEARYARQVWEIEIEVPVERFAGAEDVASLLAIFHREHETIFAVSDPDSPIEMLTWSARASCALHQDKPVRLPEVPAANTRPAREVDFGPHGRHVTQIRTIESIAVGEAVAGPAIIESGFTSVVIDPGASAELQADASLLVSIG
jgi:N-methylhydantoinase A